MMCSATTTEYVLIAPACTARLPWRTPLTLLEREKERAVIAQARSACVLISRAGRDRQDRAARGGVEGPHAGAACPRLRARALVRLRRRPAAVRARKVPDEGAAAHARAAFSDGGEPDHAVLHGLYWLTVTGAADARRRRRSLARPPDAALAGLHGQPRRRAAADDPARRPQRRAGRAADPDRAAPVDHDADAGAAQRSGGRAARGRTCRRDPRGHRREPVLRARAARRPRRGRRSP